MLYGDKIVRSIFDTFDDQTSREQHLRGEIAQTPLRHAPDLFENDPQIITLDVLAEKGTTVV